MTKKFEINKHKRKSAVVIRSVSEREVRKTVEFYLGAIDKRTLSSSEKNAILCVENMARDLLNELKEMKVKCQKK